MALTEYENGWHKLCHYDKTWKIPYWIADDINKPLDMLTNELKL